MRTYSNRQLAIFDFILNSTESLAIDAVAGSGKSTTIVAALHLVPRYLHVLFVAFNKSIAVELQAKVDRCPECNGDKCKACNMTGACKLDNVTVATLHSQGLKSCRRAFPKARIDDKRAKLSGIIARVTGSDKTPSLREWDGAVAKVASLAKSYLASTPDAIEDVIDRHEVDPPARGGVPDLRAQLVADVLASLQACAADVTSIDFDDMVWLPSALKLACPKFDLIFVDEAQDLNESQIALVRASMAPGGRVVIVGDPRQAIYQFRGATSGAFERVRDALGATSLPLSISYRCSKAVVREAQKLVPHIEAASNAPEGAVTRVRIARMMKEAAPGDFILSRINAPLMKLCLAFLRAGKPAAIQGRDVGGKLAATIRKAKTDDADTMLVWVDTWAKKETERLEKRGLDATQIGDTAECIHALAEGETSCAAVCVKLERLFADGDSSARITLSSTHKAKGMERDRVWLLRDTYMRTRKSRDGSTRAPGIEEANLLYVAITRAKVGLFMVHGDADE